MPDIIKRIENRFDDINANKKERIPSILDMMVEIVMDSPGCLDEAEFIDHLMTFVATVSLVSNNKLKSEHLSISRAKIPKVRRLLSH